MGNCVYCGLSAGFLHRAHKECETANRAARGEITRAVTAAFQQSAFPESLPADLDRASSAGRLSPPELREILVFEWTNALDHFLNGGVLDEDQEARLLEFKKRFSITNDELNKTHAFDRMVKGVVLREVMNGQVPRRFTISVPLPINLLKTEELVWGYTEVDLFEERTHRVYVGKSAGVSVRIAKGLYYHTSSFRGKPVDRTSLEKIDRGLFAITTKNLYFVGAHKSMRLPYPKIVSFLPFSDGIGIARDAANAKTQIYLTGDGWFVFNLISNLARL